MIIQNYTPFPPFYFETEDHDQELFATFLLKATFKIEQGKLIPDQSQQPVTMGDEHYGEPASSSVRVESDLCPFKSGSDLFVTGTAIAPKGVPTKTWDVAFEISGDWGQHQKIVRVHGPRNWCHTPIGWHLGDSEPTAAIDLRYENAFGGVYSEIDQPDDRFEPNPVGKGYAPKRFKRQARTIPAPQVESPELPIRSIKEAPFPQGLGPICKSWKSRTDIAGTHDQDWLEHQWPHLPDDFDFDFYMAAHPDMQLAGQYLEGDEVVSISGMSAEPVTFQLPEYQIAAFFTSIDDDTPAGNLMLLDTLAVDTDEWKVNLVWRIAVPRESDFRKIETRMLIRGERPRGR